MHDLPGLIPFEQTFDGLYGLQVDEVSEERASARVPVRDAVKQPMGLVHGGLYASIAESLTSMATARAVMEDGSIATGMGNSTSFMRPMTQGTVHAEATRRHRGRTTWVWDVEFTDDEGRLCALTRMTIAVRPRPR
jgi:1,4-dihydroxy-2-naphthoyl-CoA hydrolase